MSEKTTINIKCTIATCCECPLVKRGERWYEGYRHFHCKPTGKKPAGYITRASEMGPVPDWCPHRVEI